jgi:hypothetical protein
MEPATQRYLQLTRPAGATMPVAAGGYTVEARP